ncbi:leucine-rich repeat domain-containing protein [Frigoriglobus tundricola]|uniref:Uncharacterized protein n=1 Tax=Frigoriglobus tundricola TaxID=2774151 RepID=A0A6M5YNB3_9BACT|nr:hypothetical protein [Frigoriglobus tundricola]QJW95599.1 hypothetical protein FTUN_3149 [Frigoriglobus tundricola]
MPDPPSEWPWSAALVLPNFERGFVTRLRIIAGALGNMVPVRRLIAGEPVSDVLFEIGETSPARAAEARRLLPFPHPVSVKLVRQQGTVGQQDAFVAALLSSPLMASASALALDALNHTYHRSALVAWLTRSPFLPNVRSLSLRQNAFTCLEAHVLARSARLRNVRQLDVTDNRIEGPGAAALFDRFGDGLVI